MIIIIIVSIGVKKYHISTDIQDNVNYVSVI